MKIKSLLLISMTLLSQIATPQNTWENQFKRPVSDILTEIKNRFHIQLKYNVDTIGKVIPFADSRIRPYSAEESLHNVLSYFDWVAVKQNETTYKIKSYEYPRRTASDGRKFIDYLNTLYSDRPSWEIRADQLRKEVRERLQIDRALSKRVKAAPEFSKIRKFDGYTVQNFFLETLPGVYVCGSIYSPVSKKKHPLIICPNGHFYQGRYRKDQQQRLGTLARMGAVCVDFDLFGWGESELMLGKNAHRSSIAHIIQSLNGLSILDFMTERKDIDKTRIGVNGGSGGGSQTVLLTVLDNRFTAAAPIVSLASHFDGGCPCESGMPIMQACNGTNNAELMALFAPRPLLIVSDGKDWTASVPEIEFPYIQRIYDFYTSEIKTLRNIHLPDEGHDFGINKRIPVYDFFAEVFNLDLSKVDESRITIETEEALLSFKSILPSNALRSVEQIQKLLQSDN